MKTNLLLINNEYINFSMVTVGTFYSLVLFLGPDPHLSMRIRTAFFKTDTNSKQG